MLLRSTAGGVEKVDGEENVASPTSTTTRKSTAICFNTSIAIHLQSVLQCFQCLWVLRKEKHFQSLRIHIAIRLRFAWQYFWESTGGWVHGCFYPEGNVTSRVLLTLRGLAKPKRRFCSLKWLPIGEALHDRGDGNRKSSCLVWKWVASEASAGEQGAWTLWKEKRELLCQKDLVLTRSGQVLGSPAPILFSSAVLLGKGCLCILLLTPVRLQFQVRFPLSVPICYMHCHGHGWSHKKCQFYSNASGTAQSQPQASLSPKVAHLMTSNGPWLHIKSQIFVFSLCVCVFHCLRGDVVRHMHFFD